MTNIDMFIQTTNLILNEIIIAEKETLEWLVGIFQVMEMDKLEV